MIMLCNGKHTTSKANDPLLRTISDPPGTEDIWLEEGRKFYQCVYGWWDHCIAMGGYTAELQTANISQSRRKPLHRFLKPPVVYDLCVCLPISHFTYCV